jgi:hypothetical protein
MKPVTMFSGLPKSTVIITLLFFLAACGGGSGDSASNAAETGGTNTGSTANVIPKVSTGENQTVNSEETVTLMGTASDSDGTISSYQWRQTSGTTVTLNNDKAAVANFIAPEVSTTEILIFSLTVIDNSGGSALSTTQITILATTIENIPPKVNAGVDQVVNENTSVTLSGTATDTDGQISSYLWQQSTGTSTTLNNGNTAVASFTAPEVNSSEVLTFTLTVTDNAGAVIADTIQITVKPIIAENSAPTANAGIDQTVYVDDIVNLSGEQSSDADGDNMTYSWSFISIPNNSLASISNASQALATFTADMEGTYVVSLIVDDGELSSDIDTLEVIVSNITLGTTEGVLCDYSYNDFNDSPSVSYTSHSQWTCLNGERQLTANGIPDHVVGTFPNANNPNAIEEQSVSASYTLEPLKSDISTTLGGPSGATGYVLNGVKIDAGTAGSCDDSGNDCSLIGNTGNWSIEALGQTSFNFGTDDNNAHVQPGGSYHYHGMPEGFITKQGGNSSTMTIIGWAADGFPIYARYGYIVAGDKNSGIKSMSGSYQLITDVNNSRPSVAIYPLGTFSQDWEYVEGSGDLDKCNGRIGVTPEFPEGIYHYFATDDYPYFQRCVKGEVDIAGGTPPPRG